MKEAVVATLIDPRDERRPGSAAPAPRLTTLAGRRVALIDISKPGGSVFLDRLAVRLTHDVGVDHITRATKPTFSKLSPQAVLDEARNAEAVVLALAD
jgi:hypothetical protein